MLFNPEESIDFNGNTGPFIQYTYARIRSILRKADSPLTNSPLIPSFPEGQKLWQRGEHIEKVVEVRNSSYKIITLNTPVISAYCPPLCQRGVRGESW